MSENFNIKAEDAVQEFALYKTKYGYPTIGMKGSFVENDSYYTRISEFVVYTFPLREKSDILRDAVSNVDQAIAEELMKMEKRLQELRNYKQTLLAITYEANQDDDTGTECEDLNLAAESSSRNNDDGGLQGSNSDNEGREGRSSDDEGGDEVNEDPKREQA